MVKYTNKYYKFEFIVIINVIIPFQNIINKDDVIKFVIPFALEEIR